MKIHASLAVAALNLALQLSVSADVVVLSASRDNTLIESPTGALSDGARPHFVAGRTGQPAGSRRRGVIAFDLSPIPPGSTINSAILSLQMSRTNAGPVPVSLHRLLADWGEGESNAGSAGSSGAPAAEGDATWIHRFFDAIPWIAPGGDFASEPTAIQIVDGLGTYTWGPADQMAADVQAWLDEPASNFGWILIGDEQISATSKRFDSREHSDPAARPVLSIDFTPIPEPRALPLLLCAVAKAAQRRR